MESGLAFPLVNEAESDICSKNASLGENWVRIQWQPRLD